MSHKSLVPSSSSSTSLASPQSSRLEYLYEATIVSEENKISPTDIPVINPYQVFSKAKSSTLKRVYNTIVKPKTPPIKEYAQASRFDEHHISSGGAEQYVSLHLEKEFIAQWIKQGYTHVHFGAIRLALTFHGRKGIPAVSRVSVLDTRFTKYSQACLATV